MESGDCFVVIYFPGPLDVQHVKVDVEIYVPPEALNKSDGTCLEFFVIETQTRN